MAESVIECIKDRSRLSGADEHIMMITGEQRIPKPVYYRHKETGAEYSFVGGIGWPRDPKESPGFAVIVAVDKATDDKPVMRTLDEMEAPTVEGLLKKCAQLQRNMDITNARIYSDSGMETLNAQTHLSICSITGRMSVKTRTAFMFRPPMILSGQTLLNATAIRFGAAWRRILPAGSCYIWMPVSSLGTIFRMSLPNVAVKGAIEDYPALAALGGVVHSLMMLRPWLEFSRRERTIATIQDPLEELQEQHDRAFWEAENGIYGFEDLDEYDDGELVATI